MNPQYVFPDPSLLEKYALEEEDDDSDCESEADKALATRIQELYDNGAPLYTRALFQRIVDVVRQIPYGEQMLMVGMDGVEVPCTVKSRWRRTPGGLRIQAMLDYRTIAMVLSKDRIHYRREDTFLPLRFVHSETIYPPAPIGPIDGYQEAVQVVQQEWRESAHYAKVLGFLETALPGVRITNMVAFACSSLVRQGQINEVSVLQHSLALLLRDHCEGGHCYTQDPAFSWADESILPSMGFSVVGDGEGFLEVQETSAVLSLAPNIPVRQILADIVWPKVLVFTQTSAWFDSQERSTDPESTRVKWMLSHYDSHVFPELEDSFKNVVVYVKKSQA